MTFSPESIILIYFFAVIFPALFTATWGPHALFAVFVYQFSGQLLADPQVFLTYWFIFEVLNLGHLLWSFGRK